MNLTGNQVFSGGLALGAIAAAVRYGGQTLLFALGSLRRRFIAEIEVREPDLVYWLGIWLADTPYGAKCKRQAATVLHGSLLGPGEQEERLSPLFFEPGLGPHLFRHKDTWLLIRHSREEATPNTPKRDVFMLWVLGSKEIAQELLREAQEYARGLIAKKHMAFLSDGYSGWERLTIGAPRPLSSVVLPGDTVERLVADAKLFLSRRQWYADRGIPWRRGYLAEGPPGTGKTSLVRALAHNLGLPLYVLDLTGKEFSDRQMILALSKLPVGSILLLEDLDEQLGKPGASVTLSGLLNALDGPLAGEGRLLFVTTNQAQKLDAALDRDGRIDVRLHLGYAVAEQIAGMFRRFFPEEPLEAAEAFAIALPSGTLPPAAIQEYLVSRSEEPTRALAEVDALARREIRIVDRTAKEAA